MSSDIIVIGEPVKDFSEYEPTITYNENGRYNDFYTVTNFKVKKVIKGANVHKNIPVAQSAAYIKKDLLEKQVMTTEGFRPMEQGNKYILNLVKDTDNNYYILGVYFGKSNLDGKDKNEDIIDSKEYKEIKKSKIEKYEKGIQ